jgi:2-polyprenyl-3-methyl-5-hydroxy-6-metoxy-1,4-benzoquinol methylase
MNCSFCNGKLVNHLNAKDFKIIKCKNCGIALTEPQPILPKYELLDFHNESVSINNNRLKNLSDLPSMWQKLINFQVEMICNNVLIGGTVLEIGCGEGLLLEQISKRGYTVRGIEPSTTGAKRAALRGINVSTEYFKADMVLEKYDIVIMSHVLEHVESPNEILAGVVEILKPNGMLMLTQTNYKGLIASILKERWYAWVPDQHFWHFTIKGLALWLKKFEFVIKDKKYVSLVHPLNFKYKLANFFNNFFKSSLDQYIVIFQQSVKGN